MNDVQKIDPELMRQAMRQWATGVTVVTSQFKGEMHGMTVSSLISVSLEPALLLVSIQVSTHTHALIERAGVFGVTILHESQSTVSERFAGRSGGDQDRLADLAVYRLQTGVPLLCDGLVGFDCRVVATHPVSEHSLFIGEVLAVQVNQDGAPLIYYNRAYRSLKSL
jgi:flavin reductase (DIM6/NTAB) family NADH-FMN oxidoreductase RutF